MSNTSAYMPGFGNHFSTEALEGALPIGQNSPQRAPFGLYVEQLSGTAFTAPRDNNLRSWMYKIRPSVTHGDFTQIAAGHLQGTPFDRVATPPTQMRWDPAPIPEKASLFWQGLITMAGHGDISANSGAAIHIYAFNQSMDKEFFYNSDGDFLFVPEHGDIILKTELGIIELAPKEIAVIPRGIKFQVLLADGSDKARGYICENFAAHFRIPDLGPIGANGLANPRDFKTPCAFYEERDGNFKLINKFQGRLWAADMKFSPFDVVAWHGNYAPYKYNLEDFNTVNSVSFDHPDPSIFTVLTSQTNTPGTANIDFVIFPNRWIVSENTFRPPYYHRNIMSEFMGLIHGTYDAKEDEFLPGGSSLHNCMSAHGPDAKAFEKATTANLKPDRYHGTLAFMFESCFVWKPTEFALNAAFRQEDYLRCWEGLESHFDPNKK